ncbi:MAG: type II CRISPR RNA-guided endonuclease Cas9, partial [Pseudomonadota bacterium]
EEAFGKNRAQEIHAWALRVLPPNKAKRFAPDALETFAHKENWQARHLNDTQHMSRLAMRYLKTVCPDVVPGRGRLTAMMRGLWGLNGVPASNRPQDEGKKREDHRHHAVDAFVIACIDSAMLQKMSHASGQAELLNSERLFGNEGPPDPWPEFRNEVVAAMGAVIVSHKADHGHQGQLHEETAYGLVDAWIDGKPYNLVTRKAIGTLTKNEINRVRDTPLREALKAVARRPGMDDKKHLAAALSEFGEQNDIRRVRILKTEKAFETIEHNGFQKAVVPGDNHRIELYEQPDGEWQGFAVSVFQANQEALGRWTPPWLADVADGKFLMRLHKGDLVEADFDGERRIYRVYRLQTSSNTVFLAEHFEAGTLQKRHDDKDDPFRWTFGGYARLKKARARRVRTDPLGRVIPVRDKA